jgi:hypothetical protein
VISAGIGVGGLAAAATISMVTHAGSAALTGTGAGAATSVAGLGAATVALGAFSVGAAILSIGAVVATRAIWAGIESGDWEASFAWSLGAPGEVSGVAINILLSGIFPNEDDDPPEQFGDGNDGIAGADGIAEGTNLWGSARLSRALVAEGEAVKRTRSRVVANPSFASNTYWISESVSNVNLADVAGGTHESVGLNLIGAVDSGFDFDLHGTTAAPLDARLDSETRFNGGNTPTLRLLPLSPARGLPGNSLTQPSQNHYEWDFFFDIGAWGHGFNQVPTAGDDSFTIAAGEVARFSPDDLLVNDTDPDGDPLQIVGNNVDGTAENGTLVKQTITVLGGTTSTTFIYTPNPGFAGTETFTYVVTDEGLFDTGTITIEVLPPPPLEVVDVRLSGSTWNSTNPALLAPISLTVVNCLTLPWANVNTFEVQFSEHVNVAPSSLALVGVNVADYMAAGSGVVFDYDPLTFTATWTFAGPLGADRLLFNLDGESDDAHPIAAASDGRLLAGGDFAQGFSILPGDVNGNGSVSVTDLVILAQNALIGGGGTFPANYDNRLDINGDGAIDITDLVLTSARVTQQLPTGTPQLPDNGGSVLVPAEITQKSPMSASLLPPRDAGPPRRIPSSSPLVRTVDFAPLRREILAAALADWDRNRLPSTDNDTEYPINIAQSDSNNHQIATDLSLKELDGMEFRLQLVHQR